MAVDVSRFVTPEQDFAGIYKVTDTLDTQKQRQLAQAEQERKDDEVKRGKTAASMRFFTNYLDPKDRYTGTYYDPKMNEYLGEAISQAYELAGKGAGEAEILTAISPLVNKVNDYQQKAKAYSENKKQLLSSLKGQKGYNTEALSNLLDKELFEGADINKVDPFDLVNPLNRIFEKYGDQITNDEAIDDLVKGLPKSKITTDVVTYNSLGGRQRSKAMVDMPNLFIQEEEDGVSKFVPKYDKATDAGEDIVSDFVNEKGQTVKAPVRLLEEGAFNDIINSNPAVKNRVEALVNKAIQSGKYTDETGKPITLDSPQARNLGRALMYDMLKQKARVESNVLQETKPAQIKNITNINNGSKTEQIDLREYPDVGGGAKDITSLMQGIDVVSLVTGKNFAATKVIYNPNTKRITVTDPINNKPEEMSLTTFLQNLRPQNAAQDIKFLQGLRNPITGEAPKPKTEMITVVLKDGRKGQIPSDKIDQFLKDNPGSKRLELMADKFDQEDPFKKYGGNQIDQEDPFKKYGGVSIEEPSKKKTESGLGGKVGNFAGRLDVGTWGSESVDEGKPIGKALGKVSGITTPEQAKISRVNKAFGKIESFAGSREDFEEIYKQAPQEFDNLAKQVAPNVNKGEIDKFYTTEAARKDAYVDRVLQSYTQQKTKAILEWARKERPVKDFLLEGTLNNNLTPFTGKQYQLPQSEAQVSEILTDIRNEKEKLKTELTTNWNLSEVETKAKRLSDIESAIKQNLTYQVGRMALERLSQNNPNVTSKDIGKEIFRILHPDEYDLYEKVGGDKPVSFTVGTQRDTPVEADALNEQMVKLGNEIKRMYGNETAIQDADIEEQTAKRKYTFHKQAQVKQKIAAILHERGLSPDKATEELKDKVVNKYLSDEEKETWYNNNKVYNDVELPSTGFAYSLKNAYYDTVKDAVGTVFGGLMPNRKKMRAAELLEGMSTSDVLGEDPQFKARLSQLKDKEKTQQLNDQEKQEKEQLEQFTDLRSKKQKIFDMAGSGVGQILGLGSISAFTGGLSSARTGLGALKSLVAPSGGRGGIMAASYLMSHENNAKEALRMFPNEKDALKRFFSTEFNTAIDMAVEQIFPEEQFLSGIAKKEVSKLITNLTAKNIASTLNDNAFKQLAKNIVGRSKKLLATPLQETAEEEIALALKKTFEGIIAPDKSEGLTLKDVVETGEQAFWGSVLLGAPKGMFGYTNNKVPLTALWDAASSQEGYTKTKMTIERLKRDGELTEAEAKDRLDNLELGRNEYLNNPILSGDMGGLDAAQKQNYFARLLNEAILKKQAQSLIDPTNINKQIKESEAIREKIYKGEIKVTPENEELTKKEFEKQEAEKTIIDQDRVLGDEETVVSQSDEELLTTLQELAQEGVKDQDLQFFVDQAANAPNQFIETYGEQVTQELLDKATTEQIQKGLEDARKFENNPNVALLEKELEKRGKTIADFVAQSVSDLLKKVDNAEWVNEKEISDAENELYDLIDKNPNSAHLIEPLILKIQDYEFTTKTETRTVTEKQATGSLNKVKREVRPALEQSEGSKVTLKSDKGEVSGVLRIENGKYIISNENGDKVAVIGEKAINDRDLKLPDESEMDNPIQFDNNGIVKSVTFKTRDGNLVTIEHPEKALDIAIQLQAELLGEIPNDAFNEVYKEVEKTVNIEIPKFPEKLGIEKNNQQEVKNKPTSPTPTDKEVNKEFEDKKADIERRRQEELNERDKQSGQLKSETVSNKTVLEQRGAVNEFLEATKGVDLKKDPLGDLALSLSNTNFSKLPERYQEMLWEGKSKEVLEKIGKTYEEKVNAKYDAELKALEQQPTSTTQSEIEAKKADIERRRQEELKNRSSDVRNQIIKAYKDKSVISLPINLIKDLLEFDRTKDEKVYTNKELTGVENIKKLKESIAKEGLKEPLELAINSQGAIVLTEGNHRIQALIELGYKEVPIKVIGRGSKDEYFTQVRQGKQVQLGLNLNKDFTEDKINAKYDAELAALETTKAETTTPKGNTSNEEKRGDALERIGVDRQAPDGLQRKEWKEARDYDLGRAISIVENQLNANPNSKIGSIPMNAANAIRAELEMVGVKTTDKTPLSEIIDKIKAVEQSLKETPKAETPTPKPKEQTPVSETPKTQAKELADKSVGKYEKKAREIADKIQKSELPDWLKADLPDGTKKAGAGYDQLKKALADAVIEMGRLLDKGVEYSQAIKQAVKDLVSLQGEENRDTIEKGFEKYYTDQTQQQPPPPQTPKQEPKEVGGDMGGKKKAVLNRLYNAKNVPQSAKEGFEREGLTYKPKSQKEAAEIAKSILDEFGVDEAVELADSSSMFEGDVRTLIFAEALDRLQGEENAARWEEVAIAMDKFERSSGRATSAVNYFYKNNPYGVQLKEEADRKEAFDKWATSKKEKSWKEFFEEFKKDPEFNQYFKEQVYEELKKERAKSRQGRIKKVRDVFAKAKASVGGKGAVYSAIIPPKIITGALDVMEKLYEAGEAVAEVIQRGIDYINKEYGTSWDSEKFREEWEEKLKEPSKAPLTEEEFKKKVLDRFRNRLKGLSDKQRDEVVRRMFDKVVNAGALEYDDLRDIIADVLGYGKLTAEEGKRLQELVKKRNAVGEAAKKAQEERTDKALEEYRLSEIEAGKAARELQELLWNKPDIIKRLTSIMQLSTLGIPSLINNPVYNFFNQLGVRFPVGLINSTIDKVGQFVANKMGKNYVREYNIFDGQAEFWAKLGVGSKEAVQQLFTGLNRQDYIQKEYYGQQIRPMRAIRDLIRWKAGEKKLTKAQVIDKALQASVGIPAEVVARFLNIGDKPQRFAAEGSQAAAFAKALGLKDIDRKLFIEFPKEEAYRAYKAQGLSDESASTKSEYIKEAIIKEGQRSTFQQDNMLNDMITGAFGRLGGKDSGLANLTKSLVVSPYIKIPTNAFWSYYNLVNPEVAILQSFYHAGRAKMSSNKGDEVAAKLQSREARYWLAHALTGMAMRGLVVFLVQAGIFVAGNTGDESKKEREAESFFEQPGTLNISKLWALMRGEDPKKVKNGVLVSNRWFGQFGTLGNSIMRKWEDMTPEQRENQQQFWNIAFGGMELEALKEMENGIFANTSSLLDVVNTGDFSRYGLNTINMFTNILQPASIAQINRASLNEVPQAKGDTFLEKLNQNFAQRSSLYRKAFDVQLQKKRSIWGEPIPKGGNILSRMFGITKIDEKKEGRPMYEDYMRTNDVGFLPPSVKQELNNQKLNQEQYNLLQDYIGQSRKAIALPYINGDAVIPIIGKKYSELNDKNGKPNDELRKAVLQYLYELGRDNGVAKFYQDYPEFKKPEKSIEEQVQESLLQSALELIKLQNKQ